MNTIRTDESGALPALEDDDDDAKDDAREAAREAARADVVDRDPLEVADEQMQRAGNAYLLVREELEDERACSRMLRTELARKDARIAELEAMLARKQARLAKTA